MVHLYIVNLQNLNQILNHPTSNRKEPCYGYSGQEPELFSTVNQYVNCPERVWLEKVEHTPKKGGMTVNAVFGVAMHSTVAAFYRGLLNKVVFDSETLFRVFEIRFNSIPVPEDPEMPNSELMDQAHDLLLQFVRLAPPRTIVTIEQPYRFKMTPKLEVVCQPDLVIRDSDQTLIIIDWKTCGKKYGADQICKVTSQTAVYGMAFHEPIKSRTLLFLRKKNSEIMDIPLNPDSIEPSELIQKFAGVQKALENEIHYRNRGWMCSCCPYSYICNYPASAIRPGGGRRKDGCMKSKALVFNRKPPGSDKTIPDSRRAVIIQFPIKSQRKEEEHDSVISFPQHERGIAP